MKTWIRDSLIFTAGALIGGFVVKKYIDYKNSQNEELVPYDQLEDITESKEIEEKEDEMKQDDRPTGYEPYNEEKYKIPDKEEYNRLLQDLKYRMEEEAEEIEHQFDRPVDTSLPYQIDQCEFESLDDYDSDDYTYYADGYVTDSYGMPVSPEDIKNSLGDTIDRIFWDQSVDEIWVRNERLKMDFSIVRDIDNFADVATPRIKKMIGLD